MLLSISTFKGKVYSISYQENCFELFKLGKVDPLLYGSPTFDVQAALILKKIGNFLQRKVALELMRADAIGILKADMVQMAKIFIKRC